METPDNIAQQYALKCQELEDLKQAFEKQGEHKHALQLRVQELEDICKQQNEVMHQQDQINKQSTRQADVAIEELKKVIAIAQHLEQQVSDKDKRIAELEEANERLAAHNTDMEIECRRVLREATSIKEENEYLKQNLHSTEQGNIALQKKLKSKQVESETERVEVTLSHITQGAGWYFKTGWKVPTIMISDIVITQHDDTGNPIKGYLLKPKQS